MAIIGLCVFLFQSGRDSIIYNNNKNKSSPVFKSLSVVVVGVVDEGGDEGPLEDASAQEKTTLDQLLPLDVRVVEVACIYQTKRDIVSLMQHKLVQLLSVIQYPIQIRYTPKGHPPQCNAMSLTLTLNHLAQCTVCILFIKKKDSFKKIVRCCSNKKG